MNKNTREDLGRFMEHALAYSTRRAEFRKLLDYVDTLEAACKRAADIAVVMSHSAEREIYMILSEALDKGK